MYYFSYFLLILRQIEYNLFENVTLFRAEIAVSIFFTTNEDKNINFSISFSEVLLILKNCSHTVHSVEVRDNAQRIQY
jgi:hypothetical protein